MPRLGTIMPKLGMIVPNLGMGAKGMHIKKTSLSDALFSGVQQRVLGLLFGQPSRSYYANELITLAGAGSGAVQRELAKLAQVGLVRTQRVGNQKHYQANPDSPIFSELCLIVQKTHGLAEPLRAALAPLADRIQAAFVFGSVAKHEDTALSDIDLMVVSDDLSYGDLFGVLENVGMELGRTVNPTILTAKELSKRRTRGDAFISRVLAQPKIWLLGKEDEFSV